LEFGGVRNSRLFKDQKRTPPPKNLASQEGGKMLS